MNLLTINLTQSCTKNPPCYYCPMARWLDNSGDKDRIKTEDLLKWLDEFIKPDEWIIEFTGGEPALYYDFDNLISELCKRNYHGLIKTNGSIKAVKTDNFKYITAWHIDEKDIPQNYDSILIIRNPDDDWRSKKEYCEKNNIPYFTVAFNHSFEGGETNNKDTDRTHFNYAATVYSKGEIGVGCPPKGLAENGLAEREWLVENRNIKKMAPPMLKDIQGSGGDCHYCGVLNRVEYYLSEDLREKVKSGCSGDEL